jgi:hypothetical protein
LSDEEVDSSTTNSDSKLRSREAVWALVGPIYPIEVNSDIVRMKKRCVLDHIEFVLKHNVFLK